MDGIKLLLLLVASAQVEAGTERDYGWRIDPADNVLEYIVQINPDKKRAMEQRSVQFPNGQPSISNMPRELVGRASRVVVLIGNEPLPREPSLQALDRMERLSDQPSISAAAVLGEDKYRNIESPVRNIQGQGTPPSLPAMPNALPGAAGLAGNLLDRASDAANTLRDDLSEELSGALPTLGSDNSTMPGRNLPDPSLLAQNLTNQAGGAGSFLDEARGGLNSKFNNTAAPANTQPNPASNPQANTPTPLPDYPPNTNANSPFASNNQPSANTSTRNSTAGGALTNNTTAPFNPADRLNPPSLGNPSTIPQQRTPSSTFGTNDWVTNNQAPTNYPPASSQPNDRYNYGPQANLPSNYTSAPNPNTYQNPAARVATNTSPYPSNSIPTDGQAGFAGQTGGVDQARGVGLASKKLEEELLTIKSKLDKDKNGVLTAEEYTPTSVDGILLTLFVVSLLVNLYLGHLIRKLLMRYRLVLTNVRSQAAYT